MWGSQECDVGILTVIPVELQAVQDALGVSSRVRQYLDGSIYWKGQRFSSLLERDITFVLHCLGRPSQAAASEGVTKIINAYSPKVLILVGIAAGYPNKLKIGDVIIPLYIADLSLKVLESGQYNNRPNTTKLPHAMRQMLVGFRMDRSSFLAKFTGLFGNPILPKLGQEELFAANVTFTPAVHDNNALASADTLLRDSHVWPDLMKVHEGIRAADMESGGFVSGCNDRHPPVPWMVIRGISDLGDALKNDDFHRLASCAAATYLDAFLSTGLDLSLFEQAGYRGGGTEPFLKSASAGAPVSESIAVRTAVPAVAMTVLTGEIERLTESVANTLVKNAQTAQESWRLRPSRAALEHLHQIRSDSDWKFIEAEARCKILRAEARFALALDLNLPLARENLRAIQAIRPEEVDRVLESAICYFEHGPAAALDTLTVPKTIEEWNLRLGYLFELERYQELIRELSGPPEGVVPDNETKRLHALCLASSGNIAEARKEIEHLLIAQPENFGLRIAWSVIAYLDSLAPSLLSVVPKSWPAPQMMELVKRDFDTLARLRKAESILNEILAQCDLAQEVRRGLQGWRLACLGNHVERQLEARTYCAELLEGDPSHPIASYWAIAREYPIDFDASIAALETQIAFPK